MTLRMPIIDAAITVNTFVLSTYSCLNVCHEGLGYAWQQLRSFYRALGFIRLQKYARSAEVRLSVQVFM